MALTPERVRAFREDYRRESIPSSYRGWRHLAVTSTLCLAAAAIACLGLDSLHPLELLTIPIAWVFANLVEYLVHRGPMHRLRPGLGRLYKRHTSEHHRFFSREMMAVDETRDFQVTLFPPWLTGLFLGAIGLPAALVVGLLTSTTIGRLFYAAIAVYYLVYEWLHLCAHMPEDSRMGRLPGAAQARRHHGLHHDPRKMRRANFNFAIPLFDWLFGTWDRR